MTVPTGSAARHARFASGARSGDRSGRASPAGGSTEGTPIDGQEKPQIGGERARVRDSTEGFRTVRVDTHVHTVASYDAETMPERLIAAAERAGLDGVVVTDHDTTEGARVAANLASDADLLVVPGCEVSTADGHLIAIGVDEPPTPGRPLPETAVSIRSNGGLAVVPHPFQRSRHGVSERAVERVDGVEVTNAQTLTGVRNSQARRFAERADYAMFGGSDAHCASSVGSAATAVELPADAALSQPAVMEAMRAGRTAPVGGRVSAVRYLKRIVTNATLKTRSLL